MLNAMLNVALHCWEWPARYRDLRYHKLSRDLRKYEFNSYFLQLLDNVLFKSITRSTFLTTICSNALSREILHAIQSMHQRPPKHP